jgi:hypothetical protein
MDIICRLIAGALGREKKSMIMNIRMLPWERRRPAGIALGINSAVILYPCRRDAGAPRGQPFDNRKAFAAS